MKTFSDTKAKLLVSEEIEKRSKVSNVTKKKFITTKKIEEKYLSLHSAELEQKYKKFLSERNHLVIELDSIKYYLQKRLPKYVPIGFFDDLSCRIRANYNLKQISKICARIAELDKIIALMETARSHSDEVEKDFKRLSNDKYIENYILVYLDGLHRNDPENFERSKNMLKEYKDFMKDPQKAKKELESVIADEYKAAAQAYYDEEAKLNEETDKKETGNLVH